MTENKEEVVRFRTTAGFKDLLKKLAKKRNFKKGISSMITFDYEKQLTQHKIK